MADRTNQGENDTAAKQAAEFLRPGAFQKAITEGLRELGRPGPVGEGTGTWRKYPRPDQLERAVEAAHGPRRNVYDDAGELIGESLDRAPGRSVLADIAAEQLTGDKSAKTRNFERLARTPLGKIATTVTPPAERQRQGAPHRPPPLARRPDWTPTGPIPPGALRRRLFTLRDALRPLGRRTSPDGQHSRIAACGRACVAEGGKVSVVVNEGGRASYRGLATCGSVWECPCCYAKIVQGRASECSAVLEDWHGLDRVLMVTATVRHMAGHDLKLLRSRIADAWRAFARGAPWERLKRQLGIVGSVRALEVTHGPNGWHPHLHIAWLVKERPDKREFLATRKDSPRQWIPDNLGDLIDRWQRMVWRHITVPVWARKLGARRLYELASEAGVAVADVVAILAGKGGWADTVTDTEWRRRVRTVEGAEDAIAMDREHADLDGGHAPVFLEYEATPGGIVARVCPRPYRRATAEELLFTAGQRLGFDEHTPDDAHGFQVYECRKGDYLAKLGLELASSPAKEGRKEGHRTPLQIAGEWADTASPKAGELWQEWCAGMVGARQLTWSIGLKQEANLRERTDAELAAEEEPPTSTTLVGGIDAADWRCIQGRAVEGRPATVWILEQVEHRGAAVLAHAVLGARRGAVARWGRPRASPS